MTKKTLLQTFLSIILFLFIFFIFKIYYQSDKLLTEEETIIKKDLQNDEKEGSQNLIKDIRYTSNNNNGDIYEILAEYGESSYDSPELMFLTNVKANIIFKNNEKTPVNLTSNFANFNTETFETTFKENVKITRNNEIITGEELYLILDKKIDENKKDENLLRMSQNVFYKKPGYTLKADIIEIDLITKNSKIYMNTDTKKVVGTTLLN
tara:strand:- start:477 stop:1103 length:627 start_codon:yes stop_codon:yes gene_type:complete